jgi:hypothetical protein
MINIVTAICVDSDASGKSMNYPQVSGTVNRRELYWKLVTVFCCTSLQSNPQQRHLVFTNDTEDIIIGNIHIKEFLRNKGVTIINLAFKEFDPSPHSKSFRNAFYKLEVMKALGNEQHSSILLDSDCLWARPSKALTDLLEEGERVLLIDSYQRKNDPGKLVHGMSIQDMADLYKGIDPDYPAANPVWYGGEVIGASPHHFKQIAAELSTIFPRIMNDYNTGKEHAFTNGKSVFDNDEYISSFVYNKLPIRIFDTWNVFLRRMWTSSVFTDITARDYELPIWHLPAEKETGLSLLYSEIIKNKKFKTSDNLPKFLGERTGIPERKYKIKKSYKELFLAIKRKISPGS